MKAIQPMLITPSANSAAISAQQQPTHQPPWTDPIRSAPSRPGRQCVEQEHERAPAVAQADVLERSELVEAAARMMPPAR